MKISFHSYANETNFHLKSFARSLAFIVRFTATRKWPIALFNSGFSCLYEERGLCRDVEGFPPVPKCRFFLQWTYSRGKSGTKKRALLTFTCSIVIFILFFLTLVGFRSPGSLLWCGYTRKTRCTPVGDVLCGGVQQKWQNFLLLQAVWKNKGKTS